MGGVNKQYKYTKRKTNHKEKEGRREKRKGKESEM